MGRNPMPDTMLIRVARPSGYAGIRWCEVSLPLVPALLEAPSRYRLPGDGPRPMSSPHRSRGPNLRTLVKAALDREYGLRR